MEILYQCVSPSSHYSQYLPLHCHYDRDDDEKDKCKYFILHGKFLLAISSLLRTYKSIMSHLISSSSSSRICDDFIREKTITLKKIINIIQHHFQGKEGDDEGNEIELLIDNDLFVFQYLLSLCRRLQKTCAHFNVDLVTNLHQCPSSVLDILTNAKHMLPHIHAFLRWCIEMKMK